MYSCAVEGSSRTAGEAPLAHIASHRSAPQFRIISCRSMTTLSIQQAIALAAQHHAAGRAREAEAIYQKVLAQDPRQPAALNGLGILHYEAGNTAAAADWIGRAVAQRPDDASYQSNYGSVLLAVGRLADALVALRRAVQLKPTWADAHYNLANAL